MRQIGGKKSKNLRQFASKIIFDAISGQNMYFWPQIASNSCFFDVICDSFFKKTAANTATAAFAAELRKCTFIQHVYVQNNNSNIQNNPEQNYVQNNSSNI